MTQKRIQELQSITARLSQLDVSKLSESQLAERNTLINNIKEELTKIKEVSDTTLVNYLTKVDADSRKHPADPTKRSPEKASKSVAGFSRAFNKLDARKEQGVAEGSEDLRAKLDLYNEKAFEAGHRHDDQAWRKYTKLAKQIADQLGLKYKVTGYGLEILEQGVAESDLAQQMLALAKSKGMNARIAGTPDEERARTQQMMDQRAKERQEQERQAALADVEKLPELKAKYEEMKKLYQSLGGSNWQYADREQNLSDAERKARSMEPELNSLAAKIHRAEKAQGVTESMEDNPVASAITRRIMMQRVDLLSKYGPEAVGQAIDDVADYVGDFISDNDEIGSSDVSGWVRQVERILSDSTGITTEAYDRLKKVFDFSNFKG